MDNYKELPLRAQEEVIEEFSVSRKYTYLLAGFGVLALILGIIALGGSGALTALFAGSGPLAAFLAALIWIGLFILAIYLIGMGIYLQIGYDFFLTNQRVIESVGFIGKRTISSDYRSITDIIVKQDIINRLILGTGTLSISTPGSSGTEFFLLNIDQPTERKELLRQLVRADSRGKKIDRHYVAHLKKETGMAASTQEALAELAKSTGDDPVDAVAEEVASHNKPTPPGNAVPTGDDPGSTVEPIARGTVNDSVSGRKIEDLHGDGIDESDRLRAAQKELRSDTVDGEENDKE